MKVEFGEKVLGESPKVDCTAETPAEFNYNATYSVTFEDPISLDEIALKPVIREWPCKAVFTNYLVILTNVMQYVGLPK